MENREPVPYTVYESAQARADRRFRMMWILCLVLIILLVGTNAGWVYYESQFEDVVTTVSQDAISDTGDAIIHGDHAGAVIYGEDKSDSNN